MWRHFIIMATRASKPSSSAARNIAAPSSCTEWLRRVVGQTVELILPIFARERVGWYNWGLVAGKTQTYLDWRRELNTPEATLWQHDIFHADGRPYDPMEIELIRAFAFAD